MAYLSDDLLSDIKRDSYLPTAQGNFTDAQLLAIADWEIIANIAPVLVSFDDGFYLEEVQQTLTGSVQAYTMPQYAMWLKLKQAHMKYTSNGNYRILTRISHEQITEWSVAGTGEPMVYYLNKDTINLLPIPSSSTASLYTLAMWIYRRPGRLVRATSSGTNSAGAAQVSSINYSTGVVTYTTPPPTGYTSSSTHDFYSATSPFSRTGTAVAATAASGSTQTFATTALKDSNGTALLSAGDWVCLQDQTVFPSIPLELTPALKDFVILSLSRTQMDQAQYQVQSAEIGKRLQAMMRAPGSRVVGSPKKVSVPMGIVSPRRRILWSD